jgi:hypothetical protein
MGLNPWSIAFAKTDDEVGLRREFHRLETPPLCRFPFVSPFDRHRDAIRTLDRVLNELAASATL